MRIALPKLERRKAGENDILIWEVREPSIGVPAPVLQAMFDERPDPSTMQVPRWGEVRVQPGDGSLPNFLVSDVLIEYEELSADEIIVEDTAHGKHIVANHLLMELFGDIDPWFERVAGWISVLADQPLDVAGRLKTSITEGENLVVVGRVGKDYTNAEHIAWSAWTGRDVEPVSTSIWRRAIILASSGQVPDVVLQLLAEARVALALEDSRRAVIQASTAVELSLARRVEEDIASLDSEVASALGNERRTLGALVRSLKAAYKLPDEASQFVELRNRAVHKNYVPSREEAESGVRTAQEVVRLTTPELIRAARGDG